MNNKIIIGLVFLLIILSAHADRVTKDYSSGGKITLDGLDYTIYVGVNEQISLQRGNETIFIDLDNCEVFGQDKVCYDVNKSASVAKISIIGIESELEMTSEVSSEDIDVGESATWTINIENIGNETIRDFVYELPLPTGFVPDELNDCDYNLTHIFCIDTLFPGKDVEFIYSIRSNIEQESVKLQGLLIYNNTQEIIKEKTDDYDFDVEKYFDYTTSLNRTNLILGQYTDFTINLSIWEDIKKPYNITIFEIYLEMQDGLGIESGPGYGRISTSSFKVKKLLKYNTSRVLGFKIQARQADASNFTVRMKYRKEVDNESEPYVIEFLEYIDVTGKPLKVSTNLDNDSNIFEELQDLSIRVTVENPNKLCDFKDIKVKVKPDFELARVIRTEHLSILSDVKILTTVVELPEIKKKQTRTVEFFVEYETEFDQDLEFNFTREFDLYKVGSIDIYHDITKKDVNGVDVLEVEVLVRNNRMIKIYDLDIKESFHDDLFVKGDTSGRIDLDSQKTVSAYRYEVTLPESKSISDLFIKSDISYIARNKTYNHTQKTDILNLKVHNITPIEPVVVKPVKTNITVEPVEPVVEKNGSWLVVMVIIQTIVILIVIFDIFFWRRLRRYLFMKRRDKIERKDLHLLNEKKNLVFAQKQIKEMLKKTTKDITKMVKSFDRQENRYNKKETYFLSKKNVLATRMKLLEAREKELNDKIIHLQKRIEELHQKKDLVHNKDLAFDSRKNAFYNSNKTLYESIEKKRKDLENYIHQDEKMKSDIKDIDGKINEIHTKKVGVLEKNIEVLDKTEDDYSISAKDLKDKKGELSEELSIVKTGLNDFEKEAKKLIERWDKDRPITDKAKSVSSEVDKIKAKYEPKDKNTT